MPGGGSGIALFSKLIRTKDLRAVQGDDPRSTKPKLTVSRIYSLYVHYSPTTLAAITWKVAEDCERQPNAERVLCVKRLFLLVAWFMFTEYLWFRENKVHNGISIHYF